MIFCVSELYLTPAWRDNVYYLLFQLGIDSLSADSAWFVREVEVDMPTKGKHFYFSCKAWLARDKSDGKTSRVFTLNDADTTTTVSYKPSK